ncbi:MAG: hypothetical protein CSA75_03750 [Sorangium cellulosum]|nr:MAG: hypothetical protein CSA75_03750 [Sorangium cellulosum]
MSAGRELRLEGKRLTLPPDILAANASLRARSLWRLLDVNDDGCEVRAGASEVGVTLLFGGEELPEGAFEEGMAEAAFDLLTAGPVGVGESEIVPLNGVLARNLSIPSFSVRSILRVLSCISK